MALGELKCPSLDYVYNMTWAEFRIRLYAYHRVEKTEWYKVREIAYASMYGSHIGIKRIPSKEKFMQLEPNKAIKANTVRMAKIKQVQEEYQRQKEELNARIKSTDRS